MSSSFDNADDAPRRQAGLLSRALMRTFLKQARVVATESFARNFRLITLESPAFSDSDWTPGQKLQIAMGSAFVSRTYTPVDWDADTDQTRILGYAHGNGPGSEWLRKSRPGDVCDVLGPRKSLEASSTGGSTIRLRGFPKVSRADVADLILKLASEAPSVNRELFVSN
jgi:NADPH-dependent ferric siderophore reductase